MIDVTTLSTDSDLIESVLENGFDPELPVDRNAFLRLLRTAESIDRTGQSALSPYISGMSSTSGEIGEMLTLPVAIGDAWLEDMLAGSQVAFLPEARLDAVRTLTRRLVTTLHQTVQYETIVARASTGLTGTVAVDPDATNSAESLLKPWLDRWRTFPVLASLVTLILVNWERGLAEVIRALESDHREIGCLTGSSSPLKISALQGDAGDLHLGGRSVMLLTFSDGTRVVFKPKNLAVTDAFRSLVQRVNDAGYSPPLRVHGAIVRETHTWEEFVPHQACSSDDQVERFYRRIGGWIRLLQVIEGRDFWLDNLIANGEHPIFIDLETILQPRRRGGLNTEAAQLVQDRIDSSPVGTSIITMATPIGPDVGSEELGCFAAPRAYLSPFPATEIPGVSTESIDHRGYRTWTHLEHAPLLHDAPARAGQWYASVEAGYRDMAATLDSIAPELLTPGNLIDQLCQHPVRTIYRDTWTCLGIVQRSVSPPLLGQYRRRRAFLESMKRSAQTPGSLPEAVLAQVVAAEQRAIAALDVPFFTSSPLDSSIVPPDAPAIPGVFDGNVRDRVRQRLEKPPGASLEGDVAYLRTAFRLSQRGAAPINAAESNRATLEPDDPVAASLAIGANILERAVRDSTGVLDWTTLNYHPTVDLEHLAPLGGDLLSGRAGVSRFVTDMWLATGEVTWRRYARQLAIQVAADVRQMREWWDRSALSPVGFKVSPPIVGGYGGFGGMLAAVKLAADALEDRALQSVWREALENVPWPAVMQHAPVDVINGTVSFGLALSARTGWIDELPENLRTSLIDTVGSQEPGAIVRPPGAEERFRALPGERVARLLVQARFGTLSEIDLKTEVESILDASPSVGDLLGTMELGDADAPWWPLMSAIVTTAVQNHDVAADRLSQLDAAELALSMWRCTGDEAWRERAHTIGVRWIAQHNQTGSWFPGDLADDQFKMSGVWGVPALASVLLRIGNQPAMASPRTLNWQAWEVL